MRIAIVSGADIEVHDLVGSASLSIGTADGAPETVFGRVAGARLLSGGRIAVADAFAPAVRVFDDAGRPIRSVGRSGAGPGEFGSIIAFGRYIGDSIYVSELGARRTTVFDPNSGGARVLLPSAALPEVSGATPRSSCCELHGSVASGAFLISGPPWTPFSGGARERAEVVVGWMPGEGGPPRAVGEFPGARLHRAASDHPDGYSALHYGNDLSLAPAGRGFATTDGLGYRVDFHDPDGQIVTATVVDRARTAVGAAHREVVGAHYDSVAERVGGDLEASGLHWVANQPFADSLPGYTSLHQGGDGTLWAGFSESEPAAEEREVFDLFDGQGSYQGSLRLPAGRRFLDANGDHLLLRTADALGVERVELWARPLR